MTVQNVFAYALELNSRNPEVIELKKGIEELERQIDAIKKQQEPLRKKIQEKFNAVYEVEMLKNNQAPFDIYLNVSYEERQIAKASGARWDSDRKQWYIPKGDRFRSIEEIQRWL